MDIAKFLPPFWMSRMVNSKDGMAYLILTTLRQSWRTSGLVLSRDRGSKHAPQ